MNRLRIADEHRTGRHPATGAKARARHRTGTRIVAGVLVALMAWGAAGTSLARAEAALDPGRAARTTAADRPTVILPVWAQLDGDTPVAGAGVRVYAMRQRGKGKPGRGRLLRPLHNAVPRTSDSGTALLEFAGLSRTFTVVVSGGQANGRTLRGSLTARVRGYRSATVVYVTPVTSLIERWQHDEPGVNRARARATVYRALGIPRWADDLDLQATDRWFDGDTFLEGERRNLSRSIPQVLSEIRRGESVRFRPPPEETRPEGIGSPPPPPPPWWKNYAQDARQFIKDGFAELGTSLLASGLEAGGKWLLGNLLDQWGLKEVKDFLLPKGDTEIIIDILNSMNARITDVQRTVEGIKQGQAELQYGNRVAELKPVLDSIDTINSNFKYLATLTKEDPTRVNYAKQVVSKIQDLDRMNPIVKMHRVLYYTDPLNPNDLLKAASQVVATRRFFGAESSAKVQSVYDFYALYEFQLGVILTNYWRTLPDTYSTATIQHYIDEIQTNVDTQARERLKPPVPADKFIDTRTMTMWDRKPSWVSGAGYRPDEVCRCIRAGNICDLRDPNWADRARDLGTEEDFKGLIDGWNLNNRCGTETTAAPCSNPLEYLRKEVGLVTSLPDNVPRDQVGHMWLGPTPVPRIQFGLRGCGYYEITRINLSADETPGPKVFHNTLYDKDPQNWFAYAMTRRPVAPGSYWWPLGGQ
jgi:hypothetical protein